MTARMMFFSSDGRSPSGQKKSWRERLAQTRDSARNISRAFVMVWQAHPPSSLAMAGLTLGGALLPAAQAWVGKLIVDAVVQAINTQIGAAAGLRLVTPYLLLEFGLLLGNGAISQGRNLAEHILHARLNLAINSRIIRKALSLDLSHFENAEFYDKLENARREADWRGLQIVNGGFFMIQNVITLLSFTALLVRFSPWLAVILFAATLPAFIAQSHYADLHFRILSWRAPESRMLKYLEYLLTVNDSVKEVKLFNLGETLLGRYATLFWKFLLEDQRLAIRRSLASFGWGLVATLSYYGSYAWIIFRAAGRLITLGDMTLYLSVIRSSQNTFEAIFFGLSELYENGLFMSNLFSFMELETQMPAASQPQPVPKPIRKGVEFKDVSFRYPSQVPSPDGGSPPTKIDLSSSSAASAGGIVLPSAVGGQPSDGGAWALRHVNLTIRPGEKIALVGPNGAGKTTLIKLLTRLYDPTEGQICLDGVDLREFDLQELRQRIGVIFQDFVRYHLAAYENIGFGQIEVVEDRPRVEAAAVKSGAHPLILGLPEGYETQLGRWFSKGKELSGGEWQKIALGRAFMRESELLVLDEPTASLDAENEFAVFQRFRELAEGKMAVLISHRFSTVRMADRIYVIDNGQITERGTHAELLAQGGTYARLFTLQAQGYR